MAYYNFYWMACVNILFPFIFHVQISEKNTYNENSCQMSICLLTILQIKWNIYNVKTSLNANVHITHNIRSNIFWRKVKTVSLIWLN